MLLALLKRIVFCFTYCKMNQRFILWRLLFWWYIQYDRLIQYIEYVCYLYLMQYVNVMMMISGWLFTFSRQSWATRQMKRPPRASGYLTSHSTFQNKLLAFMQMYCQQHQRRQLPAAGDYGKSFWKYFPPRPVPCCGLKGSPTPMKI